MSEASRAADDRQIAVIRFVCRSGARPRVSMRGTSMLPLLREPMTLELASLAGEPRIGEVLVFERDGRLVAHRVIGRRGGTIYTAGDALGDLVDVVPAVSVVGTVTRVFANADAGARRVDTAVHRLRGRLVGEKKAIAWRVRARLPRMRYALAQWNPCRRERTFLVLFRALAAVVQGDAASLQRTLASVPQPLLLAMARRHRCAAFLAAGVARLGVDVSPSMLRDLQAERCAAVLLTTGLRRQVDALVAFLAARGHVPILLKGAARLYARQPEAELHVSGDIDLLVPPAALAPVTDLLKAAGYREEDPEAFARHHHTAPLHPPDGGVPLELHRTLAPAHALRAATDASGMSPYLRAIDGPSGRAFVPSAVGAAMHLAIHAREATPLRDLVLLARELQAMTSDARAALFALVDGEGPERIRLHAMVYGAALIAGIAWDAPAAARCYLGWRLRRGDLPLPLLQRAALADTCAARKPLAALRALLAPRLGSPSTPLGRAIELLPLVTWRTAVTAAAGAYALLLGDAS